MKAKINLKNIKAYLQGKIRYKLYYSRFKFLISKHIREQIDARINSMDPQCYNQGQCKLCGCQTTALQMANKACDKPCYPRMINRFRWRKMRNSSVGIEVFYEGSTIFGFDKEQNKFIKLADLYE